MRLLSLIVLLLTFVRLVPHRQPVRFGQPRADKLLLAYLGVNFAVMLYVTTFTNAVRHGVFYGFLDIFLPYYVASRSLRDVGLALFLGTFGAVGAGIWQRLYRIRDAMDERRELGRALLATLVGVLVIIFTTSSITIIPTIYWCVAGLGLAFANLAQTPSRSDPLMIIEPTSITRFPFTSSRVSRSANLTQASLHIGSDSWSVMRRCSRSCERGAHGSAFVPAVVTA